MIKINATDNMWAPLGYKYTGLDGLMEMGSPHQTNLLALFLKSNPKLNYIIYLIICIIYIVFFFLVKIIIHIIL